MILLDTHVLVWSQWEPRKLSRLAEATIRRARVSSSLSVSAITVVELASLINRGRIKTSGTVAGTIRHLIEEVVILPVTEIIAMESSYLPVDMLPISWTESSPLPREPKASRWSRLTSAFKRVRLLRRSGRDGYIS